MEKTDVNRTGWIAKLTRRVAMAAIVAALTGSPDVAVAETAVAQTAQEIRPILIGAEVPGGRLRAADGSPFDLVSTVRKKPTVLIFYRGGW